ncbi:MAG: extracellular solute-binding protein [Fimbriimonas sp.]|nr:extracellular solute-binding protein [Fimbriimonas sp.]
MALHCMVRLAGICVALAATLARAEIVENTTYQGPKTTIRYSMWGGANEVTDARRFCNAFVHEHPEVRLDVSVYPWGQYWAKVQTQMASGLAPDVMEFYSGSFGIWAARGALMPLDGLAKESGFSFSDFFPQALANCRWNGSLFALPTDIASWCLIYSTDLLEQSGIGKQDWPREDRAMTWEQFQSLSRRLTLRKPDGSFAQYGMAAAQNWDLTMATMYGGDFTDRPVNPTRSTVRGNEPLAKALIAIFQSQYGDRTTLGQKPIADGAFTNNADTILISPKFAMGTTGPWALKQLREGGVHFGITPMPRGPGSRTMISVNSLAIYSHSKHPKEAWKLLEFMTSLSIQRQQTATLKGIPSIRTATDALVHNAFGFPNCEAYLKDMEIAAPYLTASSTDLLSARDNWVNKVEDTLDAEYESRLAAVPRHSGAISPNDYRVFVAGMNAFVEKTIRNRLPDLDSDIQTAIDSERPHEPGLFVRFALPFLAVLAIVAGSIFYVKGVGRERRSELSQDDRKHKAVGYLFIAPWLLGLVCFIVGPIIAALGLSFTNWNMISAPHWIGFQTYSGLLFDSKFLIGVKNTFLYAIVVIPISLCGGLFTAGLLTMRIRGTDLFKAIIYFPALFTGAETAVLWVNMLNKDHGALNYILSWLHIRPIDWTDAAHAFMSVVLMNVFWIGGAMIIYYAGMKQIPAALYEAADLDGASLTRKFLKITIPMLSPVILFMVVMTTIGSFQVFTPALFFASDSTTIGSPNDALRFYSVNIYDQAFNNLRMGVACSYAIVLFLIIFAITYVQLRVARRFVYSEAEA